MGYRRSPDAARAVQAWRGFVARNGALVDSAGLPRAVVDSVRTWDDVLVHGCLVADPQQFDLHHLATAQYDALVQLAENYFAAGDEFFAPVALRPADQRALRSRFERQ